MKIKPFFIFVLGLCLAPAMAVPVIGAPPQDQELRVDPMAELHRDAKFIDSTELTLVTPVQLEKLLKEKPAAGYFCFAELRDKEIRQYDSLPVIWAERPVSQRNVLVASAQPGEYYPWQLGVYAPYKKLDNIRLVFGDLTNAAGDKISAAAMQCFNMGGINQHGKPFTNTINVPKGLIQVLWSGIDIPKTASGTYRGKAVLEVDGAEPTMIDITLNVGGPVLENGGRDESWRKSRMTWLNSTIGFAETPTAPYTPLKRDGETISYLGGTVKLSADGLPASIVTNYDQANQLDRSISNEVLAKPVAFVVETSKGTEKLKPSKIEFLKQTPATLEWKVLLKGSDVEAECLAKMLFDGTINYQLKVTALRDVQVKDIRTVFDYTHYASKYIMGLGVKGGARPDSTIDWKWDTIKQQDRIWLGNVNAGMQVVFKDSNYKRPLVNIYYEFGRIRYPHSWGNDNKGGINITEQANATQVNAYSGERTLKTGEKLDFDFDLLVTPVKPIDLKAHFADRPYHLNADTSGGFIPRALKAGAKWINVHHKADIYPYINYPMVDEVVPDMKAFIAKAHANDLKVRLYYTCRELTVKTPEFWMLRSLGHEIIKDGPGNDTRTIVYPNGPRPWLVHNMRKNYIPAWYAGFEQGKYKGQLDVAVITDPESRWNNYYLEGLNWMIKNMGIDGVYIDDSSFDGETMRRARRIFDADGKRRLVDQHTWNHMNPYGGYANSINLSLDRLPYVDRLRIGELFRDYNKRDFWLVEMSGIPFGLMSEMLDAHNVFRGMVFGMLPRLPWSGNPVPMWRALDAFGIDQAKMYGYWDDRNPVRSDNELIPVTTYLRPGHSAMLSMANWDNDNAQKCRIRIDEKKLGFRPTQVYLPEIDELQPAGEIDLNGEIEIPATKGHIVILK